MEGSSFFDDARRSKEAIRAKSVVDKARRVNQLRGTKMEVEREKQIEEKMEKDRAVAWAWYQHGRGGYEGISRRSTSDGNAASTLPVRSYEVRSKSSRFKIEALQSSRHSISPTAASDHPQGPSGRRRTGSGRNWDFSNLSASQTSSLFDSYELDSVSKRIDVAVQSYGSTFSAPTTKLAALRHGSGAVHHGEGHLVTRSAVGIPPMRPPGASVPYVPAEVMTIPHAPQDVTGSSKWSRSSSVRLKSLPRYSCRSISDVVPHEEMSLSVDITKSDRHKTRADHKRDGSSWNPRRISRVHSLSRV